MNAASITLEMDIAANDEDVPKPRQLQEWITQYTHWLLTHFKLTHSSVAFVEPLLQGRLGEPLASIAHGGSPLSQFLASQHEGIQSQVALLVAPESQSRQLNADYRQKDRPTNVLSFPGLYQPHQQLTQLGDLVICARVLRNEAISQNKQLAHHWAHLLLHGFLHLLGFDHEQQAEAVLMETLERRILTDLNLPDPYADEDSDGSANRHVREPSAQQHEHSSLATDKQTHKPNNPTEPIIEA